MPAPARDLTCPARDGAPLAATLFGDDTPGGSVVIVAGANGVRRGFYRPYCGWLARRGHTVLSFDYRGIGGSRPADLRRCDARLSDWGILDLAGMIDWLQTTLRPRQLCLVGHSVAAQILGLAGGAERLDGALLVAPSSGYWGLYSGPWRGLLFALWQLVIPATIRALGYLPMSRWAGEDLPAGVAAEWASWGRHPDYLFGHVSAPGFECFEGPILAYVLPDDPYAPLAPARAALAWYPNAPVTLRTPSAASLGADRVGHFDFFKRRFQGSLWLQSAEWIEGRGSGDT